MQWIISTAFNASWTLSAAAAPSYANDCSSCMTWARLSSRASWMKTVPAI
jgi:hypothetical protein